MSVQDDAKRDWKKGLKYKEIATKYGVSVSCVKSWASRIWKSEKVATDNYKKSQRSQEKLQPKNKGGAPKGSKNALGNKSPTKVKPGQQLNLKHGGYSMLMYGAALSDEEKELWELLPDSEEGMLIEQIQFFRIRERRILLAIQKYKDATKPIIDTAVKIENKRVFDSAEDKKLYEDEVRKRIEKGERLPGESYSLQTSTESAYRIIERLEAELTKVQRAKTQAIVALSEIKNGNPSSNSNEAVDAWIDALVGGGNDG